MKQPAILLLHGALGASSQFKELTEMLSGNFDAMVMNFPGHGGSPIPEEPFSISMMGKAVIKFLDDNSIQKTNVFGYSMGGYAALWVARNFPARVGKIFTLATKFDWNERTSQREASLLNPVTMMEKIPAFVEVLKERHGTGNWQKVVTKTASMLLDLGRSHLSSVDFRTMNHPIRIAVGDKDQMVSQTESRQAAELLRNGSFLIFPETLHPFERMDPEMLKQALIQFFTSFQP